ncbi:MAG: phosphoribosylformylglycinamidine synthase subunit PurL [Desulfurella sp.]|uniref:Phosphoribosylformylglycinamidine synthase subunit PurL n=2 Tax=Desulfurella multipotens TaxID=79269 RepID=A0A1G6MCQ3_9BACT|nr:phosphoribosylformylglycinamidine synthase subunit PurL [Desulfurella multipotens]SDC52725.1 phosphoribosylformylglycinamidine synthase [Desulfurella multipotens]HEX12946.1 phosphoribosylformylglycinamidine synthase subunit PurL [Desulfurella acetivorans]
MTKHFLEPEELALLESRLKRKPTEIEEAIIFSLWSEHCSYKSSKIHLKKLPTKSDKVVIGPGENAGVIDIGDGYVAVFKMESHNHPSYIDPYNGAATGVGGILRDVFTMGARPVLNMDALFFGTLNHPKTPYLLDGVVRGVGDYGNCVGVPTASGQTMFLDCYNNNILVNAFTLGIAKKEKIFLSIAKTVGADVIYVGSKTGKDGIHGATMASSSFDEESIKNRPTVQIGDPFTEKLLIEACLEVMDKSLIEAIQDMGAAGLTSSAFEMVEKGGLGVELYLDNVPLRESMTPLEIMLSESQERMLIIAEPKNSKEILDIFKKWSLDATIIGKVIKDKKVVLYYKNDIVGEFELDLIEAPVYDRKYKKPAYIDKINKEIELEAPDDLSSKLLSLISSPNLCDKSPIFEQYDSTVQTNTLKGPEGDACAIAVKQTGMAVFASTSVNPIYCYLDPYNGSAIAVLESYRNIIASGGDPIAITDCLNFGNPQNPEIMWQFVQSIEGIKDTCAKLNTPVVSGNVSLYNETTSQNIFPTPTIAMVGVSNMQDVLKSQFQFANNTIVLLNDIELNLGASQYLYWFYNKIDGKVPDPKVKLHLSLKKFFDIAHKKHRLIISAKDISMGGLACCLASMCENNIGCDIKININSNPHEFLFSESQANIIIEIKNQDFDAIESIAYESGINAYRLGFTTEEKRLKINDLINVSIDDIKKAKSSTLRKILS